MKQNEIKSERLLIKKKKKERGRVKKNGYKHKTYYKIKEQIVAMYGSYYSGL